MVKELYENGQEAAREMYGCRGWVLHHNTDLWRMNGAVDRAYVDRGLPVMRGYVNICGTVTSIRVIRNTWLPCILF